MKKKGSHCTVRTTKNGTDPHAPAPKVTIFVEMTLDWYESTLVHEHLNKEALNISEIKFFEVRNLGNLIVASTLSRLTKETWLSEMVDDHLINMIVEPMN